MNESFDVVVVGAGLAGLAAGATAAQGASTLILDGHQPGGRASTDERGTYRFNRGPHALYRSGEAQAVLARLGVATPGAFPAVKGAQARLGDRVDALPTTAVTLLRSRLLSLRGKIALVRFLSGAKKWRPADVAGLTVGQWLDTFKLPEDARQVALWLVRTATYTNNEDRLSADVAAGQIQLALVNNVLYLDNGWGSMVDSLAAAAQRNGAEIRTGASVTSIKRRSDGDLVLTLSGGEEIQAGSVVLAAGTPGAAAALLGDRPPAWRDLGPEVEASVLDLGLQRGLEHPNLFGIDPPIYLVDHAKSAKHLAPEGGGLVHVARYLPLGDHTPAAELRAGLEEHARLYGVEPSNVEEQRFLLRMTVVGMVPTPASGGLAGRPAIDSSGVPGVFVAGDWVGPRGWLADASLSSGEAAGQAAARDAARRADGVRTLSSRKDVA